MHDRAILLISLYFSRKSSINFLYPQTKCLSGFLYTHIHIYIGRVEVGWERFVMEKRLFLNPRGAV